jgi:hypothetical protein
MKDGFLDDRRLVKVEAGCIDTYGLEDEEMTAEQLIKKIDSYARFVKGEAIPGSKRYTVRPYGYDGGAEIIISYSRWETDKEKEKRIERSKKAKIANKKAQATKKAKADAEKKKVIEDAIKVLQKNDYQVFSTEEHDIKVKELSDE